MFWFSHARCWPVRLCLVFHERALDMRCECEWNNYFIKNNSEILLDPSAMTVVAGNYADEIACFVVKNKEKTLNDRLLRATIHQHFNSMIFEEHAKHVKLDNKYPM